MRLYVAHQRNRFISREGSTPALENRHLCYSHSGNDAQLEWWDPRGRGDGVARLIRSLIIFLDEASANKQDVAVPDSHALIRSTCQDILERERVRLPRVVWQRYTIAGVEFDEVQQHAAAADSVFCPICQNGTTTERQFVVL